MLLEARDVSLGYKNNKVIKKLNMGITEGKIISIIGPNGSGKSTLVKGFARCLKPLGGRLLCRNKDIYSYKSKEFAKRLAFLPQIRNDRLDITVETLIGYGRYAHTGWTHRLGREDNDIIMWAADRTGLSDMLYRKLGALSGGERQRVWLAMALAQKSDVLILDEPTAFLDICYQYELLELLKDLNETVGLTIIMVLHDINQASRYSDEIFILKDGIIYDHGTPKSVITLDMLKNVFKISGRICYDQKRNYPFFIPGY